MIVIRSGVTRPGHRIRLTGCSGRFFYILFGPNGSGKTSLMMTIMGFSGYNVTHGKITFKGEDITGLPINERALMGVGVSF